MVGEVTPPLSMLFDPGDPVIVSCIVDAAAVAFFIMFLISL